ncbi:MAG: hypothetical protein M1484_04040 [Patescibacteria group bacterium]|nr:hypothetical protein [Patescibacteria group bacterium]
MNMCTQLIYIDIRDDENKARLVARLVDQESFLIDIADVRRKAGITSVPYLFPKFTYGEANNVVNFYKNGHLNIFGTVESLLGFIPRGFAARG